MGLLLLLAGCSSEPAEEADGMDDMGGMTGMHDDGMQAGAQPPGDGARVVMVNHAYSPKTLTIKAGETVTWVNQDPAAHTVSADDPSQWGTAGSGDAQADWMVKGDEWSHRFTEPGTYKYYCKPHAYGGMGARQGMVGTVVVEA